MPDKSEVLFSFKSAGLSGDPLNVVTFEGEEAVSRPFAFRVDLVSGDPALDPNKVVNQPAVLEMEFDGDVSHFHGIVCRFEQGAQGPEFVNYHALLVPRLHLLGLHRRNRVFMGKTVPVILAEIFEGIGLKKKEDFEIKTTGAHPEREYVLQYQETDLAFATRLMEDEGIYYFFEHGDGRDKVVVIDALDSQQPILGETTLPFRSARGSNVAGETVHKLVFRQELHPKGVYLKDYNYRKPAVAPEGTGTGAPKGYGKVEEYGNHFKTPDEGKTVATWRGQELAWRERTWRGESGCRHFRTGHRFTLEDHFNPASNIEFQLLKVVHLGNQRGAAGGAYGGHGKGPAYQNRFLAIPADVQYRPARRTPKPRILGTMHATIDSGTDGHYADVDEQGRYKVILPFDLSGRSGGKASRYVRMAQPYAGHGDAPQSYGMHFPLHKGTEVLLTHIDGDPDRPVISGAVPNPATQSPVTADNATQSVIRTAAQNEIIAEDVDDAQYVFLQTPRHTTYLSLGEQHEPHAIPHGVAIGTEKGVSIHAGEGMIIAAGSKLHKEAADQADEGYQSVAKTAGVVAAVTALAGGIGADIGTGMNIASVLGVIGDAAGAIAGMTLPGIYTYAPGKVATCAGGEVVLGALGSADVIAAGPANILSAAEAMVAGIMGAAVVAGRNVELVSVRGQVLVHAKKHNIKMHAHEMIEAHAHKGIEMKALEEDFDVEAKNHIVFNALEESFTVTAKKHFSVDAAEEDVSLTGKKNVKLVASEEGFSAQAKKAVEITSEEDNVSIGAKKQNVALEAAEEITLTCGQSSISLKKDGTIKLSGMTLDLNGTTELKAKGGTFTIEAQTAGTVKGGATLEVSATTMNTIKGNPVMIN